MRRLPGMVKYGRRAYASVITDGMVPWGPSRCPPSTMWLAWQSISTHAGNFGCNPMALRRRSATAAMSVMSSMNACHDIQPFAVNEMEMPASSLTGLRFVVSPGRQSCVAQFGEGGD